MLATNNQSPTNSLLQSLTIKDRQHLLSNSEEVELTFGNTIHEPGQLIQHVYFPTASFISLIMAIDGNGGLEVGLIGNEGMCGSAAILGVNISSFQSIVQGAGPAIRMTLPLFDLELEYNPALKNKLKRYVYVKVQQLAQTAACNRFHLIEARLARWLLMTRDRAHSNEFPITQEFLAQMLGVRRVGVTKAAGSLQDKKLITYSRGAMTISDGKGLELATCSCYQSDKNIYASILHND